MQQTEVLARHSLDLPELRQVQALADEVRRADGVALKVDWEAVAEGLPDLASSFCCYGGGALAGYAFLEGRGGELEWTAAVAPQFRRQGIFRCLLAAARAEAQRVQARQMLAINYKNSESGTAAVQALRLPFVFSEYRMETDATSNSPTPDAGQIRLQRVGAADAGVLARMTAEIFGREEPPEKLSERLTEPNCRYFFADLHGTRIGQIGVVETDDGVYVRGVGILLEYRRRGFGRQLLAAVLMQMRMEGQTRFALDVATNNAGALSIYKACGFHETTVYDYYNVPLTKET